MEKKQTVFVGLSGGVDSSVAALRLKKQGYNVVGVFIKVWHPEFLECNWEAERLDAMRVAAHLDLPFLTCDAQEAYKQEVAEYFISEYKAGRTPNPDVMCNKAVKFGAFLDFAQQHGADYVATGHYARIVETDGLFSLYRGVDTGKDQSYFLWTLTQAQLQKILLPVGDTPKQQIRAEAAKAGIPVAAKKDSQGVCFLGQIDIPEFLSHFIDLQEGVVLDTTGQKVGTHRGAYIYTVGQRHGFTVTAQTHDQTPYYVVAKDIEANTVTVDTQAPKATPNDTFSLVQTNWITKQPEMAKNYTAQFRYRQQPTKVSINTITENAATITLHEGSDSSAPGQSCVLYDQEQCVGGGIIAQ